MKKKLSYRDKLLELAYIYNVKEIQEYVKRRKNLTTGQIELILKKNKIIIPKEFKTSFIKENFVKPISRLKTNINDFKEEKIKAAEQERLRKEKEQREKEEELRKEEEKQKRIEEEKELALKAKLEEEERIREENRRIKEWVVSDCSN